MTVSEGRRTTGETLGAGPLLQGTAFILRQGMVRAVAYVQVINENEAEGPLFQIYDEVQRSRGRISNILSVESLNPKGLKAHLDLYMTLQFGKSPLSRREREIVAIVVSKANDCGYCVTHHAEALDKYVKDPKWMRRMVEDPASVDLSDREQALVAFARGLTLEPAKGRKEAVEGLRAAGFDDVGIVHATEVVAYFNFVNRLASGLGVELEQDEERDYEY